MKKAWVVTTITLAPQVAATSDVFKRKKDAVEDYIASIDAELLFPCLGEAEFERQEVIHRYVEDGSYRDGENSIVMIEKKTVLK